MVDNLSLAFFIPKSWKLLNKVCNHYNIIIDGLIKIGDGDDKNNDDEIKC